MTDTRRATVERFFNEYAVDAILFSNMLNIRYLTGFSGSDGLLLLTRDRSLLLCDSRYVTQAGHEAQRSEVRQFSDKWASVSELAEEIGLQRIGFEAASMTVATHTELVTKLPGRELVAVGAKLDQIRSVKDRDEIQRLAAVAELASDALLAVLPLVQSGISEAYLARELEFEMRRRGADGRAFDFIVASGERGAMPHGRASDKLLAPGELITIDFGAVMGGYHSDETVTIALGTPDQRSREIYTIVREAHDRAMAAARPGMACAGLDAVAREYIAACGYGDCFGHGLGHGVGLEIHERPTISPRSDMTLMPGMVFTIEPGIYIPGFGGVRIEDTVVVTEDGCRPLTKVSKELMIV